MLVTSRNTGFGITASKVASVTIDYDTPDNYCKRFYRGELEKKDTFSKRILTEEPKFVQKRKDTEK